MPGGSGCAKEKIENQAPTSNGTRLSRADLRGGACGLGTSPRRTTRAVLRIRMEFSAARTELAPPLEEHQATFRWILGILAALAIVTEAIDTNTRMFAVGRNHSFSSVWPSGSSLHASGQVHVRLPASFFESTRTLEMLQTGIERHHCVGTPSTVTAMAIHSNARVILLGGVSISSIRSPAAIQLLALPASGSASANSLTVARAL